MDLINRFMSGQMLLDFGSWYWNTMLLGWTKGLWGWHLQVSVVPWPLHIDAIISFCIAVFLIGCIWFILSWVVGSFWVGLALCWLFIWFIWLIILALKWFFFDLVGTIIAWMWPFVLTILEGLWSAIAFFFKWLFVLFIPGIVAAALLTVIYENYGGTNNIWYVWSWMAVTAAIAIMPISWFIWHYSIMLLFFFGTEYKNPIKTPI